VNEERENQEPEDLDVDAEQAEDVKGGVQSPRDPATGQATGRRTHKPLGYIGETEKNLG
jgi:hypothetical protein